MESKSVDSSQEKKPTPDKIRADLTKAAEQAFEEAAAKAAAKGRK